MLRLAIVGAGIMGANHARVSMGLRDATTTWIVDPDEQKGAALAHLVGGQWAPALDQVLGDIDAAVIAAPSPLHHDTALALLGAGVHVLVEKPLATTVDDAEEIVKTAEQAGLVLAVGHVEAYNPAVWELDNLVDRPIHINATRISAYSPRVTDDVVVDLMIHDLEIVQRLADSEALGIDAIAMAPRGGPSDLVSALLTFANGVTASVTASRLGQNKIRELRITQPDNFISVDLVRQDVTISRVDHAEFVSAEGARYRQSGVVEIPFLERRGEPLFLELTDFVECVATGREPRSSGRRGLAALRLAMQVREAASGGGGGKA